VRELVKRFKIDDFDISDKGNTPDALQLWKRTNRKHYLMKTLPNRFMSLHYNWELIIQQLFAV